MRLHSSRSSRMFNQGGVGVFFNPVRVIAEKAGLNEQAVGHGDERGFADPQGGGHDVVDGNVICFEIGLLSAEAVDHAMVEVVEGAVLHDDGIGKGRTGVDKTAGFVAGAGIVCDAVISENAAIILIHDDDARVDAVELAIFGGDVDAFGAGLNDGVDIAAGHVDAGDKDAFKSKVFEGFKGIDRCAALVDQNF